MVKVELDRGITKDEFATERINNLVKENSHLPVHEVKHYAEFVWSSAKMWKDAEVATEEHKPMVLWIEEEIKADTTFNTT